MGINGINDYSSILNNYRVPSIPVVSVSEVAKQDQQKLNSNAQLPVNQSSLEDFDIPSKRRDNAALEDISLTFNKGDDYSYIGRDSDIFSLDVENAISDMQKDDVLKQYRFFVGSMGNNGNAIVDNADGIVVPKF